MTIGRRVGVRGAPVPGLMICRYDAPLCFANAEDFRRRALAAVESWAEHGGQPVRWFVLNAEANVEVDLTALDAVEQLRSAIEAFQADPDTGSDDPHGA